MALHHTESRAAFRKPRVGGRCIDCTAILTGRIFGGHCARCYRTARTWGDPGQRAIKLQELRAEWFPRVLQVRALAPQVDWGAIGGRWQIIVDRAHVKVNETYMSSRALGQNKLERGAAAVLIDMTHGMDAQEALNIVAAAYLHRDSRPGAYRSEKSLWAVIIAAMRCTSQQGKISATRVVNGAVRPNGSHRPNLNRTLRDILVQWVKAAYQSPAEAIVALARKQDDEALGRQHRSRDAMAELNRAAGLTLPSYHQE
jgi:hypothetical protein